MCIRLGIRTRIGQEKPMIYQSKRETYIGKNLLSYLRRIGIERRGRHNCVMSAVVKLLVVKSWKAVKLGGGIEFYELISLRTGITFYD